MRSEIKLFLAVVISSLASGPLFAQFPYRFEPSVDVWNFHPPCPVQAEGKVLLVYELQLVSGEWQPLDVQRLRVLTESGEELATFEGAVLEGIAARPGFPSKEDFPIYKEIHDKYPDRNFPPIPPPVEQLLSIAPAQHAVFFLWIERDARLPIPKYLRHEWTFARMHAQVAGPSTLESDQVSLSPSCAVELAPPVESGRWFVSAGPADQSHHRRAQMESRGHMGNAQRFAIDLVKIDGKDLPFANAHPTRASDYFVFGEDVLAVADATVVEVLDGLPGREDLSEDPMAGHTVLTLDEMAGNQVSLDLGGGRFALYAHLQPGSIRVKVGQRVHVGEALGKVGNSGTAMGPHIHFQVSTQPGLRGEGLPFTFRSFESAPMGKPLVHREHEIPLSRRVVVFLPQLEERGQIPFLGDELLVEDAFFEVVLGIKQQGDGAVERLTDVHFGDVADFVRIGAGAHRPLERIEYVDADFDIGAQQGAAPAPWPERGDRRQGDH